MNKTENQSSSGTSKYVYAILNDIARNPWISLPNCVTVMHCNASHPFLHAALWEPNKKLNKHLLHRNMKNGHMKFCEWPLTKISQLHRSNANDENYFR